jgi:hypothetical protein
MQEATRATARAAARARAAIVAIAAAAATLLAFAAAPAAAQYNKTEPPKTSFRVGPLRLQPKLELRHAGSDSNNTLDPTNPTADTSVFLRASLEGFVPAGRRVRLYGEGWLDWTYFRRSEGERSTDAGGQGHVELDVGPLTLTAGGGGLQARQLYSIDIDERIQRHESWVSGGAEWRLTTRLRLSGGAQSREFRYDPFDEASGPSFGTAASLDRKTLTAVAALRYKLTSMTTAVGTAEMIEDDFRVSGDFGKTRSYRYLAGFEFGGKALVSGSLMAGLRDFPADTSGSLPSYSGATYRGTLSMPLFNSMGLEGSFLRDVYVASNPVVTAEERARNAYVLTQLVGTLSFELPLDLLGRASVGYTEATYLVPTIVSGVPLSRVDHLYTTGGNLLRRFSDSLRVGGTVTYSRRVSTFPGNSYNRWVYGVAAEFVP